MSVGPSATSVSITKTNIFGTTNLDHLFPKKPKMIDDNIPTGSDLTTISQAVTVGRDDRVYGDNDADDALLFQQLDDAVRSEPLCDLNFWRGGPLTTQAENFTSITESQNAFSTSHVSGSCADGSVSLIQKVFPTSHSPMADARGSVSHPNVMAPHLSTSHSLDTDARGSVSQLIEKFNGDGSRQASGISPPIPLEVKTDFSEHPSIIALIKRWEGDEG